MIEYEDCPGHVFNEKQFSSLGVQTVVKMCVICFYSDGYNVVFDDIGVFDQE
jgi:hypothetical protein